MNNMINKKSRPHLFMVILLLLISTELLCAEIPATQSNFAATQTYFNSLIGTTNTPLARLNLFVNQIPKGADLHHHYSGALYAETYLDWVQKRVSASLSPALKY